MLIPYSILIDFVDIVAVLNDMRVPIASITSKEILIRCVMPHHADPKPSLSIHKYKGYWHCFGCHSKGSLLTLVEVIKGLRYPETIKYIRTFANNLSITSLLNAADRQMGLSSETTQKVIDTTPTIGFVRAAPGDYEENTKPVLFPMGTYFWTDEVKAWCIEKNIIEEKIRPYFDIGFCRLGMYKDRIVIPITSERRLVDFQARDITGKSERKDLYVRGIPIGNYLFNYDNINWDYPVAVVEGAVDVFRLWPYYWNSVGVMGSNLNDRQAKLLEKAKGLYVMPDPDAGGFHLLNTIKEKLSGKRMWLRYFDKTDPETTFKNLILLGE